MLGKRSDRGPFAVLAIMGATVFLLLVGSLIWIGASAGAFALATSTYSLCIVLMAMVLRKSGR